VRGLEVLDQQCGRLQRRVLDLLELSHLQLGRLELQCECCDLDHLIAEVVERLQTTITEHHLLLAPAHALVVVDCDRIEQVLTNLVGNAIKFSPKGGEIGVSVSVHAGAAVVAVQDQGIGIPAQRQARLFEQFYRAHADAAHQYEGMGIGLHLSREIVRRHGGRMWFESEEGHGSTFYFSLPLAHGASESSCGAQELIP
jgi:signal transduction histidine kinase